MKVTFIIADTWSGYCAMEYTGTVQPPRKRTVTIELTTEQMEKIKPRKVGNSRNAEGNRVDIFEEVLECFVESEAPNETNQS